MKLFVLRKMMEYRIQNSGLKLFSVTKKVEHEINILYDSKCYLCLHEINFLARMDKKGVLMFTDIEDPQFDSTIPQNGGVDYATGMKRIHAIILPHGEVISGVRVFREAYNRVGMSWLYSFTKIPWIGKQAERVYEFWAAYRTQLTRGEDLDTIIARRNELLQSKLTDKSNICIEDSCKVV